MKKPIIGIVARYENNKVSLKSDICTSIYKCGGLPLVIVPLTRNELDNDDKLYLENIVDKCDGLLMPGGSFWTKSDEYIYSYALGKNTPILGICMGMQLMCKMDIDSINFFDNTIKNETSINHNKEDKKYVHCINTVKGTILNKLTTDSFLVNSRHNYHVPGIKTLNVCAYSEDDLIEAVEDSSKKFCLGVQWHPESMIDYDKYSINIINAFIYASKEYHLENNSYQLKKTR